MFPLLRMDSYGLKQALCQTCRRREAAHSVGSNRAFGLPLRSGPCATSQNPKRTKTYFQAVLATEA